MSCTADASVIHIVQLELPELDAKLIAGFNRYKDDPATRKTHLFNGRYENIYINSKQLPELATLLEISSAHASRLLNLDEVKAGSWFNHMPPGAVTTKHNHDVVDELLSAAYYLDVPADSGDLLLYENETATRLAPRPGQLIMFPADLDHEVTPNHSDKHRLSIGINFGPIHDSE